MSKFSLENSLKSTDSTPRPPHSQAPIVVLDIDDGCAAALLEEDQDSAGPRLVAQKLRPSSAVWRLGRGLGLVWREARSWPAGALRSLAPSLHGDTLIQPS